MLIKTNQFLLKEIEKKKDKWSHPAQLVYML
jgi:hypothetical protein